MYQILSTTKSSAEWLVLTGYTTKEIHIQARSTIWEDSMNEHFNVDWDDFTINGVNDDGTFSKTKLHPNQAQCNQREGEVLMVSECHAIKDKQNGCLRSFNLPIKGAIQSVQVRAQN